MEKSAEDVRILSSSPAAPNEAKVADEDVCRDAVALRRPRDPRLTKATQMDEEAQSVPVAVATAEIVYEGTAVIVRQGLQPHVSETFAYPSNFHGDDATTDCAEVFAEHVKSGVRILADKKPNGSALKDCSVLRLLVDCGANDLLEEVLSSLKADGDAEVLKTALMTPEEDRWTLLARAVFLDDLDVFETLLSFGAECTTDNFDFRDARKRFKAEEPRDGWREMREALEKEDWDAVEHLLYYGGDFAGEASPFKVERQGKRTLLHEVVLCKPISWFHAVARRYRRREFDEELDTFAGDEPSPHDIDIKKLRPLLLAEDRPPALYRKQDVCGAILSRCKRRESVLAEVLKLREESKLAAECEYDEDVYEILHWVAVMVDTRKILPRLHLCGPKKAGKTLLRHQLQREVSRADAMLQRQASVDHTTGVEMSQARISGDFADCPFTAIDVAMFDHGDSDAVHQLFDRTLRQPMTILVIVIPIENPRVSGPPDGLLRKWIKLLNSVACKESNKVLVAANVFVSGEEVADRKAFMKSTPPKDVVQKYRERLSRVMREFKRRQREEEDLPKSKPFFRLNFLKDEPIFLRAVSPQDWHRGSENLWKQVKECVKAFEHDPEASEMPALCADVLEKIPRIRQMHSLQSAADARDTLQPYVQRFRCPSTGLLDELLKYAERCGEVLLQWDRKNSDEGPNTATTSRGKGGKTLLAVIWDPKWFCSSLLGRLFTRDVEQRELCHKMHRRELTQLLQKASQDCPPEGRVDQEMFHTLPNLLEDMHLCVDMEDSSGKSWLPIFQITEDAAIANRREEAKAMELTRDYMTEVVNVPAVLNAEVAGRVLSLNSLTESAELDRSWQMFPVGSFARFQAKVMQNFPPSSTPQAEPTCNVRRNYIEIGFADGPEQAHVQCQMVHGAGGQEVAWVAWVWAAPGHAAAKFSHPLNDAPSRDQDRNFGQRVLNRLVRWMEDASEGVHLHHYDVEKDGFEMSGRQLVGVKEYLLETAAHDSSSELILTEIPIPRRP